MGTDVAADREFSRKVAADWMLGRQIEEHADNAVTAALGNLFNATLIAIVFSFRFDPRFVVAGLAVFAVMIWRRLALVKRIRNVTAGDSAAVRHNYRDICLYAALLGGCWGLTVGGLMPVASASEQMLLATVCAGMLSAGFISYRTLVVPAWLFIGLCGFGGLVGFALVGTLASMAAAGMAICFMAVLFVSAKHGQASFIVLNEKQRELAESAETIGLLLNDFEEQGSDWLFTIDADGKIIAPCARFAEVAGLSKSFLENTRLVDLLVDDVNKAAIEHHFAEGKVFRDLVVSVVRESETQSWSISARPLSGQRGFRGVISDITAQRNAEAKVNYMAHYDSLTDLPNRTYFSETLFHAINRRGNNSHVGLMYLDLDHFKAINDTLGHHAGDELLQAVARRLENCVGKKDVVARLGGDEFAILIAPQNVGRIEMLAEQIITQLSTPFRLSDNEVVSGASLGIALAPIHAQNAQELLKNADLALYTAKSNGRNRWAVFETGMDTAAQNRRMIELDLRASLGRGEMKLHFQPLLNIETRDRIGYEALLRWEHPTRGIVMPDEFIGVAEETGMIVQLGEWVIREALHTVRTWTDDLIVAVNLSPAQMRSGNLVPTIVNALAASEVEPHRLELEITESILMNDSEANLATLHQLRDLGVRIALDDFGTGYSSLNYLRSFPFDKIKIDRCFVSEIDTREDCQAIVRSVIELAKSLGMTTTAEGVEREEQMAHLSGYGCTQVQGYLFSKAQPTAHLTDLRTKAPMVPRAANVQYLPATDIAARNRRDEKAA